MRIFVYPWRPFPCRSLKPLLFMTGPIAVLIGTIGLVHAQVTTSITPTSGTGSLGTTVIHDGNLYNITGGTRPGNGVNLFHSLGNFSVGAADTANFLNTPVNGTLPLTANILGRVTEGNVSNIFGTIQTTGFGNANLFLMNPAGFLFGPNATVNVGGMVTFTTADYMRLADGGRFNVNPNAIAENILSAAPVAAFGFLGSNPGTITVQGSQLTVTEETGISLVGGDITIQAGTLADATIQPAKLSAHGGQINLVSVVGPGEVLATVIEPTPTMALGSINLSQGTLIDVTGNAGGTVRIRGGTLVMDQAVISADSINADGAPVAIDINSTGNVSISTVDVPALTARTTDAGNAGEVRISSGSTDLTGTAIDSFIFSVIDTHTSGSGKAGNVSIATGDLTVTGISIGGFPFFIDGGTIGPTGGHGGDISITAHAFNAQDTLVNSGNSLALQVGEESTGSAGNVSMSVDSLQWINVGIVADAFSLFRNNVGQSGNISITGTKIDLADSFFTTLGGERGGRLTVNTDQFVANNSQLAAQTFLLPGGGITLTGRVIELTNGSSLASSTGGDGNAGPINITATDHLAILRANPTDRQSGIFSNSFGRVGKLGNAGDITITTPRLDMTGGARINTSTATSGRGGNVTITADSIRMSGEAGDFPPEPLFALGVTQPSGIFTLSVGGKCSGPCGNAGNISINTESLSMGTGSQINSGTSSSGQGGNIIITASDMIAMSGTLSTGQPGGIQSRTIGTAADAGSGGNIALSAVQSISISNGASVSASSTGPGNAGNISINAGQQFDMRNSSVKTEAAQASGGKIDIRAVKLVRLVDSRISTSVLGGAGSGGDITIDPNVFVLQNSDVIARAVQGAGGNITITTPLFLADSTSLVSASSQFGLNGTVTIQSPTSNLSESLGTLTSKPSQAQSLLTQRCAALANGQASSFVVAGREQLPADPGSWLTSPFALAGLDADPFKDETLAEGTSNLAPQTSGLLANDRVSLRRLTPVGFLIANFADSEATGCHS